MAQMHRQPAPVQEAEEFETPGSALDRRRVPGLGRREAAFARVLGYRDRISGHFVPSPEVTPRPNASRARRSLASAALPRRLRGFRFENASEQSDVWVGAVVCKHDENLAACQSFDDAFGLRSHGLVDHIADLRCKVSLPVLSQRLLGLGHGVSKERDEMVSAEKGVCLGWPAARVLLYEAHKLVREQPGKFSSVWTGYLVGRHAKSALDHSRR